MSVGYLRRLLTAAHELATVDAKARACRSERDWSRCLEQIDDGEGRPLTCLQHLSDDAPERMFDSNPICSECEANRSLVKQEKEARHKRYLAMCRVIRLAAHVTSEDAP